MGAVYEAEKVSTHETFAVKVIREHLLQDRSHLTRFEREVEALRAIRHPNVVNVFEWSLGRSGSGVRPFVVMELLEGESLQQCLRREGVLPALRVVRIALQAIEGLAAAHAQGVLHRDLGPSNLFLQHHASGKITVKLLDFGLARQKVGGDPTSAMTQKGTLLGKPAYVAPELFRSRAIDERADVFACGVLLFRMLSGRLPYKAPGGQELWVERWVERESGTEYPPVSDFAPGAPPLLVQVASRALRKNPDDRYRTAREMQLDLLHAERGLVEQELPSPGAGISADGSVPTTRVSANCESATVSGRTTVTVVPPARPPRRVAPAVAAAAVVAVAVAVAWTVVGSSGGPAASTPPATPASAVAAPDVSASAATGTAAAPTAAFAVSPSAPADGATERSEPDAGGSSVDLRQAAPAPPATPTVHFDFAGLPPGAQVEVDGRAVDPAVGMDVARSAAALPIVVTVSGGQFEPWEDSVVADHDRVIRPRLTARARTGGSSSGSSSGAPAVAARPAPADGGREPPDADSRVIQGRMGTEFLTDWRGEH
ncbi:MAG: serine/threonine protein kinase [Deltaproteobacteria bacterium]|nr:serine/threonine protein kinase [Deltaproteobacteria bacterium]